MGYTANDESVTNLYFDYSGGKEGAPTLTVMVGPAGSGKSTVARSVVNWGQGRTVRVNRDTLRAMLYCDSPWNNAKEQVIRRLEEEAVRLLLAELNPQCSLVINPRRKALNAPAAELSREVRKLFLRCNGL